MAKVSIRTTESKIDISNCVVKIECTFDVEDAVIKFSKEFFNTEFLSAERTESGTTATYKIKTSKERHDLMRDNAIAAVRKGISDSINHNNN